MAVTADWVTAIATVVLAIGVPVTLMLTWNRTNKALREERYAHYVARYQRIFSHLPYNVFAEGNQISKLDDGKKVWLVAYIDLCAEELYDKSRGTIEKKVWGNWAEAIIQAFERSTPLQEVFNEVKADYKDLDEFLTDSRRVKSKQGQ